MVKDLRKTMKGNENVNLQIGHLFMTDIIFVQVIFSKLLPSPYNFLNKEKYNINLRFIEGSIID